MFSKVFLDTYYPEYGVLVIWVMAEPALKFKASDDCDDDNSEIQFFLIMPLDSEISPSIVAINVSLVEYGHVLLIPRILDFLPQRIDHKSLFLALQMANEAANPYFMLGYNSLCAFAIINHLHFQAYYLTIPFSIKKASSLKSTTINDCVRISKLLNYPVI
ncbi:hypothetical protein N665_1208s0010 [Sinapis alba]|nr:hypothetical protein N665_1208s0010 [Sinapis alba]